MVIYVTRDTYRGNQRPLDVYMNAQGLLVSKPELSLYDESDYVLLGKTAGL